MELFCKAVVWYYGQVRKWGLIQGGASYRREICISKLAGLIIGGNLCQNF